VIQKRFSAEALIAVIQKSFSTLCPLIVVIQKSFSANSMQSKRCTATLQLKSALHTEVAASRFYGGAHLIFNPLDIWSIFKPEQRCFETKSDADG